VKLLWLVSSVGHIAARRGISSLPQHTLAAGRAVTCFSARHASRRR
jgi:hypothetical protein